MIKVCEHISHVNIMQLSCLRISLDMKNPFCTHEKLLCGSNTFTHSRVEAPDMLRVGTSYKSPLVALVATSYVEKV